MANFPRKESEIIALAQSVIAWLTANTTVYPLPPVATEELTTNVNDLIAAQNAAIASAAATKEAYTVKDEVLETLKDNMKSVLRYAENAVDYSDEKLQLLGWGGPARPKSQEAPGQARNLEVINQGPGWIALDWKPPVEGGSVKAYKVQRRIAGEEESAVDVGTALDSEFALVGQPRGKELVYHVVAINKAGEGMPSNIVRITL